MSRDVFVGIADPTRRQIIDMVSRQELKVNDLADAFSVSRPAISKHVKILEECGLLNIQQQGRERYCRIRSDGMKELARWIEQYKAFWNDNLDQLEYLLKEESKNKTHE